MKKLLLFMMLFCLCVVEGSAKTKTMYRNMLLYAYSQVNSVNEDANIRLEIYNGNLYATNLTNKTIFIDISQCFKVHNGSSFPMYSQDQNEKSASKKGHASSIEEFITVAPATGNKQNATFICPMNLTVYGRYTQNTTPTGEYTDYDNRLMSLISEMTDESLKADPKGKEYLGAVSRHLTEDESINNIGVSIAYSHNKRAEEWTNISMSTWVSDVVFAPYYVEIPDDDSKKKQKGFKAKTNDHIKVCIKADSPFEFDEDKSPMIPCDWQGDFKRGTFELQPAYLTTKISFWKLVGAMYTFGATLSAADRGELEGRKQILYFEGPNADWGKMTYTKKIGTTTQEK